MGEASGSQVESVAAAWYPGSGSIQVCQDKRYRQSQWYCLVPMQQIWHNFSKGLPVTQRIWRLFKLRNPNGALNVRCCQVWTLWGQGRRRTFLSTWTTWDKEHGFHMGDGTNGTEWHAIVT